MNSPANVRSLETIRDFRAALIGFSARARESLDEVHSQVRRVTDWLDHDRPHYWGQQVRRGHDLVAEARRSLQACQMRTVGNHRPACIEEKQALGRARQRLEYAERQVQVVRNWQRKVQEETDEFRGRSAQLSFLLENDVPKMTGLLDRLLLSLEAYVAIEAPLTEAPPIPETTGDKETGT